ncbi:LysR family transcriptional regulator [Nocardia zapadnayensis]|uniref:LysR family transcriptional regulator n=1 Tax=Nocardia rhamnosiphila TaxID=426716 RepID=UPI002247AE38|nr:LysR family transcriptional regulator [Nocardia zapadnayensis]MCX0275124.1 LysR family transcriptional regulator [Nocardia zapadnayensis]
MAPDFDLNLVRTFVLLYETRSVTVTADLLGVTQPTVSYGLGKLRRRLGDELFVRGSGGLVATSEAERLYRPLHAALAELDRSLNADTEFVPTRPTRFTLGLSDLGEVTILPLILTELAAHRPDITVRVSGFDPETAADQLTRGELDAVVAGPVIDSPRLRRTALFAEGYAGMVAADHPRLRGAVPSRADLEHERYITVDGATAYPAPYPAALEHHLGRRTAVRVTRFAALPHLVQDSEWIAVVPERAARALARTHAVRVFALPWRIEPVEVASYTRRTAGRGGPQRWLSELIRTATRRLPGG